MASERLNLLYDFGGDGPVVHLAHANGFPPATYRPLAETLVDRYHVIALPSRPLWPGSRPASAPDWHPLADDLIEGLDGLGLSGIVGVGHSLGGVLTMWAAVRRPDLFRAVVLVDPVILPPARLWVVRLLRALRIERRLPLVQGALCRRRVWPSRRACYDHYRGRPFFARWPDPSLWAYVEAGTRERADGQMELVYPPEWEAHVFATVPTDAWQAVPRLRSPALIVRGEHSATFRPECLARVERLLPHARFAVIAGAGHLVPMERPGETGMAIRAFLDAERATEVATTSVACLSFRAQPACHSERSEESPPHQGRPFAPLRVTTSLSFRALPAASAARSADPAGR